MQNAFMSTSGERLRQARAAAKYGSAADAARAMNIPYGTYAGHENGNRGFGGNLDRYAQFFGVRGEWLRTGAGTMKPGKKHPVVEIYETLPPEKQAEAIRYLRFLQAA